jgi:hypothetical protein
MVSAADEEWFMQAALKLSYGSYPGVSFDVIAQVGLNKKNNFFKKKICTFHGKHVDKSFIYRIFNKKIKY